MAGDSSKTAPAGEPVRVPAPRTGVELAGLDDPEMLVIAGSLPRSGERRAICSAAAAVLRAGHYSCARELVARGQGSVAGLRMPGREPSDGG
jgi:hypothetical protein